jgi:hypothetical protein
VHIARFLQPLERETGGRRRGNSFRSAHDFRPSRVSNYYITLSEPQVEPVQNSDGEEDSASHQEAPEAVSKASEDVSQPSKKTKQSNNLSHAIPL